MSATPRFSTCLHSTQGTGQSAVKPVFENIETDVSSFYSTNTIGLTLLCFRRRPGPTASPPTSKEPR